MRRFGILALAPLLLSALWMAGCGGKESTGPRRQAILILLDAARPDRFGFAGYERETTPEMDELAAGGAVFLNHYCQATATRASLPQMIFSRYFVKTLMPSSESVPYESPESLMKRLDDEAISLPRALAAEGFATAVISAHSWIKKGTAFAAEFQELEDLSAELHRYAPPAKTVIDRAIPWIEEHDKDDYFLYLHLMDTHFPHRFGPEAKAFFGKDKYEGPRISTSRETALEGDERRYMDALYDGGLRRADHEVGRLVAFLKKEGLFEDTLIAITADHGEHLLEVGGRFAHGGPWYERVARIPLILSYPRRLPPARVNASSEMIDLAPTILRLLDVTLPEGKSMDGADLAALASGEAKGREVVASSSGLRASRFKILFDDSLDLLRSDSAATTGTLKGELYDLEADPEEIHNLWDRQPDKVDELTAQFRAMLLPKFERYDQAENHEQPTSPFAIRSTHFRAELPLVEFPEGATLEMVNASSTPSDWVRSKHWEQHWLLAREEAPPLDVSFPVPNGDYEVTIHARGHGKIVLGESDPLAFGTPPFDFKGSLTTESVSIGEVSIDDEMFRARIEPPGNGSRLWIKMLGFRPIMEGAAPIAEEEHLEQLRALGYIK